jgi:hypothetical protein
MDKTVSATDAKRYDPIWGDRGAGMLGRDEMRAAGSPQIGAFERGRSRLRRTRSGYGCSIDVACSGMTRRLISERFMCWSQGRRWQEKVAECFEEECFGLFLAGAGGIGHTSGARARASGCFGNVFPLRRINEATPPDRSPEDLLGSELFDEDHGATAMWTEPCSRSTGGGSVRCPGVPR